MHSGQLNPTDTIWLEKRGAKTPMRLKRPSLLNKHNQFAIQNKQIAPWKQAIRNRASLFFWFAFVLVPFAGYRKTS